ncbi:MAG: hypothetical protein A2001_01420 [Treponema sp. GWC1_61_84]|nr:MAG: hypothetical protein A2001_01420 [Treponema sp. GWC1_61_84]
MMMWGPWVDECVDMLDGKGTQRHWKYGSAYADQPAADVRIYRIIRLKWVDKMNADIKAKSGA